MLRPRVYVETTIPSLYRDTRSTPAIVAMREWTREWWHGAAQRCELVTGPPVLEELAAGPADRRQAWLNLVENLPVLDMLPEIVGIVETYIRHKLMPADSGGDPLHLALASVHKCDFLVTWNCRHLANANKFGHIRQVNARLGLFVPTILTPLELLGKDV